MRQRHPGFLRRLFSCADDSTEPDAPQLRARVEGFWSWFGSVEAQLYGSIQARDFHAEAFAGQMQQHLPGLAWEFCPVAEEGREGLTISGDGDPRLRLVAHYLIGRAPTLQHFRLFAARQAQADVAEASVQLQGGEAMDFADFRFDVDFDAEHQCLELRVHHPQFAGLPEEARQQLSFLALDNALGEDLIETHVGGIDIATQADERLRWSIDALRRQARAALSLHEIDADVDPMEQWVGFQNDPDVVTGGSAPRADIIAGTTRHPSFIDLGEDAELDQLLQPLGAVLCYIQFPTSCLAAGEEVAQRGRLEDELQTAMGPAGLGVLVGGALGSQRAYIDLMLCDEAAALPVIREVLRNAGLLEAAQLRYFGAARAAEQLTLGV